MLIAFGLWGLVFENLEIWQPANPRSHANFRFGSIVSSKTDVFDRFQELGVSESCLTWPAHSFRGLKVGKSWIFENVGNLRIQGRMQIFEKMSQKALNRVLTLPDYSIWPELLISSGIIDLQNNRVCKQFKHWKYRISVPMLYIAFIHGQQMSRIQTIYCHNHKIIITITVAKL